MNNDEMSLEELDRIWGGVPSTEGMNIPSTSAPVEAFATKIGEMSMEELDRVRAGLVQQKEELLSKQQEEGHGLGGR